MNKIPLIVVAGATASGKTSLSIELAKKFNGEIISCDSMQIYRDMNIGTAKPDDEEKAGIVHHIMDFLNPEESFSVADFTHLAHEAAETIHKKGKRIVCCGGTGLYIDSFVNDVDFDKEDSDEGIREELRKRAETEGAEALLCELRTFDSESAEKLHPNNLKRIIRAIEFYRIHKISISEHQANTKKKESRYDPLFMMIDHPREVLYDRINKRVDIMIESGLLEEAEELYKRKDTLSKTALQAIGYKEMFDYFKGEKTLEEAKEELKLRTRQYAKRQLTWFRRNEKMHLLPPDNALTEAEELVREFLKQI